MSYQTVNVDVGYLTVNVDVGYLTVNVDVGRLDVFVIRQLMLIIRQLMLMWVDLITKHNIHVIGKHKLHFERQYS